MGAKKVKISSVKRALHLKSKKNFSKPQSKKASESLSNKAGKQKSDQKNIFVKKSKKNEKSFKKNKKRHVENFNDDELDGENENDEQVLENIMDIIDPDDLELLQLSNINEKRSKKRKHEDDDNDDNDDGVAAKKFEIEHTKNLIQESYGKKHVIDLLPIKSKDGEIITRTAQVDYKSKSKVDGDEHETNVEEVDEEEDVEYEDSDDDIVQNSDNIIDDKNPENLSKKVVSTTDLLILRQQEIERQKYRIGIICSGILEKPEDKIKNFSTLFDLMEEYNENGTPNLLSVRKLAIISIAEIFKDILPEYRVGQVDTKMTTVRKTTLERVTYESALLQKFKKYLQKLEKITACVTRKGGHKTKQNIKLAEVSVISLCDILLSHTYFNYVQNIAQLLVYMLNSQYQNIRETVNKCFRNLFSTDKKLDMTLYVVRRINHLIKTKSNNVHVDMITCFMNLKIKNINLDAEKENELKQKKMEQHRQRLLNLSKRERKRRKKLAELNKELQETKAEENKQTKNYKLTEITKMLFTIYFRILKNDPNSKLLSACLEGLAEFAHVINVDFFSDLIEVLNKLLESCELGYREQLHCIQTIFVILSGQGEVLNIDPIRFYSHLYRNLLIINAGKNHDDFMIILKTLNDVLIKRRKNITQQRLLAFIKRLSILSLHLLHNGTLASLGIIKTIMQLTSSLDIILDTDTSYGTGRFDPELDDPEFCNASCTALYELSLLVKHYHPIVKRIAEHIILGLPTSGEGSLPLEIGKLSPEELFIQFDSSKMAFNPNIPIPKQREPKLKKNFNYLDRTLKKYCKQKINKFSADRNEILDFFTQLKYGQE